MFSANRYGYFPFLKSRQTDRLFKKLPIYGDTTEDICHPFLHGVYFAAFIRVAVLPASDLQICGSFFMPLCHRTA